MREAAANLEFETAARLRDEVKRLRQTELAIADDPMARQSDVEDRAGSFKGAKKYGASANMPAARAVSGRQPDTSRVRKPTLDEMTVGRTEVPLGREPVTSHLQPPRQSHADERRPGPEKKERRGRPRKTGRPGA